MSNINEKEILRRKKFVESLRMIPKNEYNKVEIRKRTKMQILWANIRTIFAKFATFLPFFRKN